MHVSVAAETLFKLGPLPITNSFLMTIIVTVFLLVITILVNPKISNIPSRLQAMMEIVISGILGLTEEVAGKAFGRKIFPLLGTFFIFIIIANWSGLLPGVGSIGIYETKYNEVLAESNTKSPVIENNNTDNSLLAENKGQNIDKGQNPEGKSTTHEVFIPLFRGPTADLNVTLALALISVFMIQFYGIKTVGLTYFKKFINFRNPINGFIGILELVSEFSRIISFAFRLFGNIFAGEVLLTVIAYLIPFVAPLPFIGLELFVGFIQALVFTMLSLVFISMATQSEH